MNINIKTMTTTYTLTKKQVDHLKKTGKIPLTKWAFYDEVVKQKIPILKEEFGGGENLNIKL